jgi:hypothetical protein
MRKLRGPQEQIPNFNIEFFRHSLPSSSDKSTISKGSADPSNHKREEESDYVQKQREIKNARRYAAQAQARFCL